MAVPAVACVAQVVLSGATNCERVLLALFGCRAALAPTPANQSRHLPALAAVMLADGATPPAPGFDFMSRLLYLAALSLGMMLGLLFLTGHASRIKFDLPSWSLAFPLEALALATLVYAAAISGTLTNGMAYAGLAVASTAVVVLSLHTLHALLMGGIFVQVGGG